MRWFRRTPLADARWVAIDCETSGLDAARERLLSVGMVGIVQGRVQLSSCFHALVKQEMASAARNILVHGIGGDAQLGGLPLPEVMEELALRVGDAIPVAFHAPFDRTILRRHGLRARQRWLDLAALAPALFPGRKARALEEWLDEFAIDVHERHDALGDAFSTAQLLLVVLAEARRQGIQSVERLRAAERERRWLA